MPTVALLGTLDTKGVEYAWMRERLEALGHQVLVVDVGVTGSPSTASTASREEVARRAGTTIDDLVRANDRGRALAAMAAGATEVVLELVNRGEIDAVLSVAGSGGSSVASAVMRALPIGFPKLLVSTMASGDVSPYVGAADVTLMYSVVDVAGINRLSEAILGNAVAAVAGMATENEARKLNPPADRSRPLVGASMFGVTTPAVEACRARLEEAGYEVLVFHATGSGGKALEGLAAGGYLEGVLDLTTTELADELVGGVLSAGPERLTAAGRARVPQVVSLGALDMVNFGPRETVPAKFSERLIYEHNSTVTLMRTSVAESAELGRILGEKLVGGSGARTVVVPLHGVSALDVDGGLFRDEAADSALFNALEQALAGSDVELVKVSAHINDPEFAETATAALLELMVNNKKVRT
ncbi:Tm-1-like ATP-binding domain-containing protein [Paenarthrobacter sp. NPDC018779]|uniref:Tm-1-like ATP-binding domain-containing protein n=1 Tax=Paenarthrobacter sp. NPDC018779 TaxID=3364375 RepID=UPI0037CBBEE7